jgi:ankyrin repeat protein
LTPLHVAAMNGVTATAELLIAKGAAINVKNSDGQTPVYVAAAYGHEWASWDLFSRTLRQTTPGVRCGTLASR